jgi:hypothetical protein
MKVVSIGTVVEAEGIRYGERIKDVGAFLRDGEPVKRYAVNEVDAISTLIVPRALRWISSKRQRSGGDDQGESVGSIYAGPRYCGRWVRLQARQRWERKLKDEVELSDEVEDVMGDAKVGRPINMITCAFGPFLYKAVGPSVELPG